MNILEVALDAARKAAVITEKHRGSLSRVEKKGKRDLVTIADTGSEKAIVSRIQQSFTSHTIIAEESGKTEKDANHTWVIDPLDGTTNFAHGLPFYAISIAYLHNRQTMVGVVFCPPANELFSAVYGQGAFLNNHKINVSPVTTLSDSLLVTGFPYDLEKRSDLLMERFTRLAHASQGIRRLGAAALDLCYVACGRFEGFWEEGLKPWDTAAGALVAREAGARITTYEDASYHLRDTSILATNSHIHEEMLTLLRR